MQYALLIYESEADQGTRRRGGEAQRAVDDAYAAYTKALLDAGVMRGGEALQLPDVATTVTIDAKGAAVVHDGPFADTKEQLGGFFIIECESLDQAMKWAGECPAARTGKVEIRPTSRPPQ